LDDAANSGNYMIERDSRGNVTNVNIIDAGLGKDDKYDLRRMFNELRFAADRNQKYGPKKALTAKENDEKLKELARQAETRMQETRRKIEANSSDTDARKDFVKDAVGQGVYDSLDSSTKKYIDKLIEKEGPDSPNVRRILYGD